MKKIWFILLFSICIGDLFACVNEYRTRLTGEVVYTDPVDGKVYHRKKDSLMLKKRAKKQLADYKNTHHIEQYSDYAATLIFLGKYKKAKSIYEEIERMSPHLYTTASNLGTIYELIGKPDSALIWIKKSIELNPESHYGSEWIHIKILEHKILTSNSTNQSILGLDFGNDELPSNPNNYNLEELRNHIWHQLSERTVFVKPQNLIVGNIYFDLGNVIAQTHDVQAALESYEAAKEYGFKSDLMDKRIVALEKLAHIADSSKFKGEIMYWIERNIKILLGIGALFFIGVLLLVVRLIQKRASKNTF